MTGLVATGLKVARVAMTLAAASVAMPSRAAIHVDRVAISAVAPTSLPTQVNGRVVQATASGGYLRQWPGTYFETGFRGTTAMFRIGQGDVILHLLVDGRDVQTLVKPAVGLYRLSGLPAGQHQLRIEVATETQSSPTVFGGFFADGRTRAVTFARRRRQIEYIGDSHTVGYGDLSRQRQCTPDKVWATTDTSRGFGAMLARRYDADYEVNAISGRGVVRNYDGFAADKLPDVYPYVLFDKQSPANDPEWHPQIIVVALGTNDFTTALRPGEKWASREALHLDYEARYTLFMRDLRARNPNAHFVLWATDMANGEIESEVGKVVAQLQASGEPRVTFVPISGLAFSGCHSHPSLSDQEIIARKLGAAIAAAVGWADKRPHPRS
jgi:lysophospholipase L1-like esterase